MNDHLRVSDVVIAITLLTVAIIFFTIIHAFPTPTSSLTKEQ